MPDDDVDYPAKHLARNIPENFDEIRDRIHHRAISLGHTASRRSSGYDRTYRQLFSILSDEVFDQKDCDRIGPEIDKILVLFLAIQQTLDRSVPAKPVYDALRHLNGSLRRTIAKLEDPDRDGFVDEVIGQRGAGMSGGLRDRFEATSSLAEKVTVVRNCLDELSTELKEIEEFFDYKRGMVTPGNPSKYALVYAVHALGELFERENTEGLKAAVNEFADGGRGERQGRFHNQRRYTGKFLGFVEAFYHHVVPEEVGYGHNEGFADQVRKLARNRRKDPDLTKLLDAPVPVDDILAFMTRADAVK